MKNISYSLLLFVIVGCSKKELIELPITTSSEKALKYYKKAQDYYLTTDFPEGWAMLDSALALDPNFALASLWRWHPDPSIRIKNRKKRRSIYRESESMRLCFGSD